MEHDVALIPTLAGGLAAALVFGLLANRLKLSPIVGYLAAGIAVGPFTPGFVAHPELASELAEVGVILLMFGVGLSFHLSELLAVRKVAIPGALAGATVATLSGLGVAKIFGFSAGASALFGLTICATSTVVLLRVLGDRNEMQTPAAHVAIGWLVVEDLIAILSLVLVPVFFEPKTDHSPSVGMAVAIAVGKVALLVVLVLVAGSRAIPWLLERVAKTRSRELFTLTVLVVALGVAVVAAQVFGASMALGAFLGGMVVGQSEFGARAASEALPMRDAFAVLFFVSIGMLFDPHQLWAVAPLALATLAVVFVGKPLVAFTVMRLLKYPNAVAVVVAAALAQIGEFSFIVATVGRELKVLPDSATQVLVAVAMVSITASPFVVAAAHRLAKKLDGEAAAALAGAPPKDTSHYRAIVVGGGPVGRTLVRVLRDNGIEPSVVELNHQTVVALQKEGIFATYGDASQPAILEAAGVKDAQGLVFAASGSPATDVVRVALALNPKLRVLARATYASEIAKTEEAGAQVVIAAEVEVALAMAENLLNALGATPEQLDHARERARRSLHPAPAK
ncbi:MAG TPA: cation:proton antiporter [Polyangiaceae bacterium]